MPTPLCKPHHANLTVQTQPCKRCSATLPCKPAVGGQQPSTGRQHQHCHACLPLAAGTAGREQDGAGRAQGQEQDPWVQPLCCAPLCPARHRSPSVEGSMGPSPPTSPAPAAVSGEVVMGTVCCRYPSPWVPLLASHGDSGWRTSSAYALSRAWQGGQGGHGAPRGGSSPQGCSGDAGSTQGWRSPVCPRAP